MAQARRVDHAVVDAAAVAHESHTRSLGYRSSEVVQPDDHSRWAGLVLDVLSGRCSPRRLHQRLGQRLRVDDGQPAGGSGEATRAPLALAYFR